MRSFVSFVLSLVCYYRPLVTAEQTRRAILRDVLERLFEGSFALLVAQLLVSEEWTRANLHALGKALEARERALRECMEIL